MSVYLHIGGVVAIGFSADDAYLMVVSHDGSGLFETENWQKIARDGEADYYPEYPQDGYAAGIGVLQGQKIAVKAADFDRGILRLRNHAGTLECHYGEGTLTICDVKAQK